MVGRVAPEDQVAGLGAAHRRGHGLLTGGGARQEHPHLAEHVLGEPRAVEAGGRRGAAVGVHDAELLLRHGQHPPVGAGSGAAPARGQGRAPARGQGRAPVPGRAQEPAHRPGRARVPVRGAALGAAGTGLRAIGGCPRRGGCHLDHGLRCGLGLRGGLDADEATHAEVGVTLGSVRGRRALGGHNGPVGRLRNGRQVGGKQVHSGGLLLLVGVISEDGLGGDGRNVLGDAGGLALAGTRAAASRPPEVAATAVTVAVRVRVVRGQGGAGGSEPAWRAVAPRDAFGHGLPLHGLRGELSGSGWSVPGSP